MTGGGAARGPLAVYVHIPYCAVICGYCDFNTYSGLQATMGDYAKALVAEVEAHGSALRARAVTSIGFGGGTPGEFPAEGIAAVIAAIASTGQLVPGAEVTLEANPGTTGPRKLAALRRAGVTRISFGAQSFVAGELAFLDRLHSPESIGAAVGAARAAGFDEVSLDLMYGLPGQALADWCYSLERALALHPDHISAYALTVEAGTPLAKRVEAGEVTPLDADLVADMYEACGDMLEAAGYRQYELSNWAVPGHESRHNQAYWRWADYLAIGAGAHGFIDGERSENVAHPREYIEALRQDPCVVPVASSYRPDRPTMMFDWITTRLRLIEGLRLDDFTREFRVELGEVAAPVIASAVAAGVLESRDDGMTLAMTRRGRQLHGEVSALLLEHLSAP